MTGSIAGFVTVARPGSADLTVRLRWTIAARAPLTLPLPAGSGPWGAALAVAGIGLAVAPHLIALFGRVERAGPAEGVGEAMTVRGSGLIAGHALAAAASTPFALTAAGKGRFGPRPAGPATRTTGSLPATSPDPLRS
ncbi:hypothetical protein [Streptomyces sp. NPDC060031]|uniref:hypothetical protein n=1 Tax=Streptomyces sp. NPDC060031 TaxID=3347043 RepID=UPI003682D761